ncbi:hypothetical protein JL720_12194 [Aureococcus anophagefferens]|nr:hypothetical protein JL720_12194 [Aureococcus anophagefferens]
MAGRAFAVLLLCAARCAGAGVDISFEVNDLSVAGDEFVVRLSIDRERLVVDDDVAALVRDGLRRVVAGRISDDHVATLVPAALAEARDVAAAQVAAEAPIRALLTPTAAVGAAFRWGDRGRPRAHVAFAVRAARRGLSALTAPDYRGALDIVGMSAYGRHLLNNLLNAAGSRYLEIGTFKGSTLVAASARAKSNLQGDFKALAGNEFQVDRALAVDSYAFGGDATFVGDIRQSGAEVRDEALANLETFLDPRAADRRELRVADCFSVDAATIGRFNVYLYDGDHEYDDQFRAFTHFDAPRTSSWRSSTTGTTSPSAWARETRTSTQPLALQIWGEEPELVESSSSEEEDDGASPGGTRKAQRNKNTPATRRARGKSDSRAWDPAEAFLEPDSLSDDDADDEEEDDDEEEGDDEEDDDDDDDDEEEEQDAEM